MSRRGSADAVVVGAGCVGASVAFHLARRGASVIVFEREKTPGAGSTGHCAGGVRQQFSTRVNVLVSKASVQALENFREEMGTDPGFGQCGYLFCVSDAAQWQEFQRQLSLWQFLDVPARAVTAAEAKELVPVLLVDDLVGCTFCPTDGIADPHLVTQGYVAAARRHGAEFVFDTAVAGVRVEGGAVRGVVTTAGETDTRTVVNAAGPHAAEVGHMAGVEIPVAPVRRQMFTTQPLSWLDSRFPMVVDMNTGVYMHRESGGMLVGLADNDEPPSFNTNIDFAFRDKAFLLAMQRVPRLADAEYRAGWAGLHEVTPDHNAILGPVPGVAGLFCANGFSGHGFMHSPAVLEILAGLILDGASPIDISPLSIEGFRKERLDAESYVI